MTMRLPLLAQLPAILLAGLGLYATHGASAAALELQGMHVPVSSIKQLRFQQTLHQQYDFSCGSAALATLLTYQYGIKVTEQAVFEQMYQHGNQAKIRAEGFSLLDMQRYLASRGMRADGFALPLQELIKAALPAIVLVTEKDYRHFVVIKGARDGRVLIGDPANGTRALPRDAFEAIWQNRLLFVIHDVPGQPRFNALADWRAAPRAPLADGLVPGSLADITLPKHGASAF
jgi:predicted double-glycine peptidase